MREADTRAFRLLRAAYAKASRYLDSDGDVAVEPVRLGFSVCFRHDMDRFDERGLEAFLAQDERLGVPSTLFFLEGQFRAFPHRIRSLAAGDRYECALHSEAKPMPWSWSLHQLSRLLERSYSRRLRRQVRRFERVVGPCPGHAAHAVHNYLPFQGWINWNIIENASLRAGLDYISDWRLPSRVAEGEEFPAPWPAYARHRGGRRLLVLPTSWDDKYLFYSYEDLRIRRIADPSVAYRERGVDEAMRSILEQAGRCRDLETPLVLNIHPWHAVANGQPLFLELKSRLVDWAAAGGVPVQSCRDYLEGVAPCL